MSRCRTQNECYDLDYCEVTGECKRDVRPVTAMGNPISEQNQPLVKPWSVMSPERLALENIRMYCAKYRNDWWGKEILRFCAEAGVKGSPLRGEERT